MSFDILLKGLLIGGEKCGKSALLLRFSDDTFSDSCASTIGVDFKIRTAQIGSHTAKLQLWDTAGAARFRTITTAYYRGAHMIFLCCDLSDSEGANELNHWWEEIQRNSSPDIVVAVVGCKSDEASDPTCMKAARDFAEQHNIQFFATSAKRNEGVDQAFMSLAADAIEKIGTGRPGHVCHGAKPAGGGGDEEVVEKKKKKKNNNGFFGGWGSRKK